MQICFGPPWCGNRDVNVEVCLVQFFVLQLMSHLNGELVAFTHTQIMSPPNAYYLNKPRLSYKTVLVLMESNYFGGNISCNRLLRFSGILKYFYTTKYVSKWIPDCCFLERRMWIAEEVDPFGLEVFLIAENKSRSEPTLGLSKWT